MFFKTQKTLFVQRHQIQIQNIQILEKCAESGVLFLFNIPIKCESPHFSMGSSFEPSLSSYE